MLKIIQIEAKEHKTYVQEFFCEYFYWSHFMFQREFNITYDVNALLEQEMTKLQQFTPPQGRFLLGEYEEKIAGCA
ncbi:MAG: GNAT family N-acetyltransferase, partial [Brasilonema sp.]